MIFQINFGIFAHGCHEEDILAIFVLAVTSSAMMIHTLGSLATIG
jgi:hypothetical protein